MKTALLSTARDSAAARSLAWQQRRTRLLQEACTEVAHEIAGGVKLGRAIKTTARKFRTRSLGNGQQLSLSAKSLERHWYRFKDRGESAFALRYVAGRKADIDPLLLRLIVDGCIRQSKSISQILTEIEIGDRNGRASLATLYRALPAKEINRFLVAERSLRKQRQRAEQKLAAISARLSELRREAEEAFLQKGLE